MQIYNCSVPRSFLEQAIKDELECFSYDKKSGVLGHIISYGRDAKSDMYANMDYFTCDEENPAAAMFVFKDPTCSLMTCIDKTRTEKYDDDELKALCKNLCFLSEIFEMAAQHDKLGTIKVPLKMENIIV